MRINTALLLVTAFVPVLAAQDTQFIAALERAQSTRPATIARTARIAPESEPGTPLVIHGTAFADDGRTPLGDVIVFAYHTDKQGLYDAPGAPAHSWRLRGWARTDASGRFEFRTIRPGSYPSGRIPAHVHFTLFTSNARYHAGELQFADDPFLPADRREASGEFGSVRPVRREGTVEHVDFRIRLNPAEKF
jgi:protocatechuate 3,4-dioxygenase beta subunit